MYLIYYASVMMCIPESRLIKLMKDEVFADDAAGVNVIKTLITIAPEDFFQFKISFNRLVN